MIESTEYLLFEFRIYLEQDAESSDVRPVVVGRAFSRHSAGPAGLPHTADSEPSTAYDRCDDRTFPEPSDVPVWDQLVGSYGRLLGTFSSRE